MNILHMETEVVLETGQRLNAGAQEVGQAAAELLRAADLLEQTWQGDSAYAIIGDLAELARQFEQSAAELEDLGARVSREVRQWEETDREGAARFSVETTAGTGESLSFSVAGELPQPNGNQGSGGSPFDTIGTGKRVFETGSTVHLLSNMEKLNDGRKLTFRGANSTIRRYFGISENIRVKNLPRKFSSSNPVDYALDFGSAVYDNWDHDGSRFVSAVGSDTGLAVLFTAAGSALAVGAATLVTGMSIFATAPAWVVAGTGMGVYLASSYVYDSWVKSPIMGRWKNSSVRKWVVNRGTELGDWVADGARKVGEGFSNAVSSTVQAGKNLTRSTMQGVKNLFGFGYEKVKQAAQGVENAFNETYDSVNRYYRQPGSFSY